MQPHLSFHLSSRIALHFPSVDNWRDVKQHFWHKTWNTTLINIEPSKTTAIPDGVLDLPIPLPNSSSWTVTCSTLVPIREFSFTEPTTAKVREIGSMEVFIDIHNFHLHKGHRWQRDRPPFVLGPNCEVIELLLFIVKLCSGGWRHLLYLFQISHCNHWPKNSALDPPVPDLGHGSSSQAMTVPTGRSSRTFTCSYWEWKLGSSHWHHQENLQGDNERSCCGHFLPCLWLLF